MEVRVLEEGWKEGFGIPGGRSGRGWEWWDGERAMVVLEKGRARGGFSIPDSGEGDIAMGAAQGWI